MGIVKSTLYRLTPPGTIPLFKKRPIFPVLHIVANEPRSYIDYLFPFKNIRQFREDLDTLLRYYRPIDLPDLQKAIEEQGRAPSNTFFLTFDDGLSEVAEHIAPILLEKGIPSAFFLNPDFVDNKDIFDRHEISLILTELTTRNQENLWKEIGQLLPQSPQDPEQINKSLFRLKYTDRPLIRSISERLELDISAFLATQKPYLTTQEIKKMIDQGFYFGGHTCSHPLLPDMPLDEQFAEAAGSVDWVKKTFDIPYSLFAIPFTDDKVSKSLLERLLKWDEKLLIFGNSGFRKDIDKRIIQRFALENPRFKGDRQIPVENMYRWYLQLKSEYVLKRTF